MRGEKSVGQLSKAVPAASLPLPRKPSRPDGSENMAGKESMPPEAKRCGRSYASSLSSSQRKDLQTFSRNCAEDSSILVWDEESAIKALYVVAD